jgi:hypothetical protein
MKNQFIVQFSVHPLDETEGHRVVARIVGLRPGISIDKIEDLYSIRVASSRETAQHIADSASDYGFRADLREEVEYDEADYIRASHVIISVTRAPVGRSGPRTKTAYSLDEACQSCGTGAVVDETLRCSTLPTRGHVALTGDFDLLISSESARLLERWLGPNSIVRAVGRSPKRTMEWLMLQPRELARIDTERSAGLIVDQQMQCSKCRRDGYFDDLAVPLRARVDGANDLLIQSTWQRFGVSRRREETILELARPKIILPIVAMKAVRQLWQTAVQFVPITTVES